MQSPDYIVKFDPEKEDAMVLFERIVYALILRRIVHKKPTITHICGQSGEGKSLSALFIMYILFKIQGMSLKDYMDVCNVYNQEEYADKLERLLKDKAYKKVNVLAVHEGRESMEADEWQSLFNRNLAHVNALSRAIKRMAIFIISQHLKDITKAIRRTLHYQIKIFRRLAYGQEGNARLFWYIFYEDDRDPENPFLRKRRVRGIVILPNGRRVIHKPKYFQIPMVDSDIKDMFDERDVQNKLEILTDKLAGMRDDIKSKNKGRKDKIQALVNFYALNEAARMNVLKRNKKGNYRAIMDFGKLHDLKPTEVAEFERKFKERLDDGLDKGL